MMTKQSPMAPSAPRAKVVLPHEGATLADFPDPIPTCGLVLTTAWAWLRVVDVKYRLHNQRIIPPRGHLPRLHVLGSADLAEPLSGPPPS
jgi:hypothetical protein